MHTTEIIIHMEDLAFFKESVLNYEITICSQISNLGRGEVTVLIEYSNFSSLYWLGRDFQFRLDTRINNI